MKKDDWIGIGSSIALHVMLAFVLANLLAATPEPAQLGFIEVELGPFSEGRPVQQGEREVAAEPTPQPEPVEEQPEPEAAPPEVAKPVDLPDETEPLPDEEAVESPETDVISPETQNDEAEVRQDEPQPPQAEAQPVGSGADDGTRGATEGTEGEGGDEARAAPYQIEGLDRSAVFTTLPAYPEKVNADIKVRIVVNPQGRVASVIPTQKGVPALDRAVIEAVRRWRFNPLPSNVPQDNQTGVVTFRFRLE